jgi:hypothetical protein
MFLIGQVADDPTDTIQGLQSADSICLGHAVEAANELTASEAQLRNQGMTAHDLILP